MKDRIDHFMKILTQLTKDEADMIKTVLAWPDEDKQAFLFAKVIFEDKDEDEDEEYCQNCYLDFSLITKETKFCEKCIHMKNLKEN